MKQNFYIFNNGRLKRQENTIFFEKEDNSRAIIPIENTEAIYAFGEIDFNSKLFNYLAQKGIPVHIFLKPFGKSKNIFLDCILSLNASVNLKW